MEAFEAEGSDDSGQKTGSDLSIVSIVKNAIGNLHLSDESDEESDDLSNEISFSSWDQIVPGKDKEYKRDSDIKSPVQSSNKDGIVRPLDCWRHFITDEIMDLMVTETNRYAEAYLESHVISYSAKVKQWKPTTSEEMLQFLGVVMTMGLVKLPVMDYYWSKSELYGCFAIQKIMSRDRFELLRKFWHFVDNRAEHDANNRLFKIRNFCNLLMIRFQEACMPGNNITIDETMVPWRGRLLFRQYIPGKAHKYGVKIYKLCTVEGYTWSFYIYTGQSDPLTGLGHGQTVVMKLAEPLLGCNRIIYADNFFTSIELAKQLLDHNTYLVGTMRSNRTGSCREIAQKKLKRNEISGFQNNEGIKLIKWKDKRDVLMITSLPLHDATLVEIGRSRKNEPIIKPQVVLDYNKAKQGVDLSDQLSSYYTCLKRTVKWYRKVVLELILGTAVVNARAIYNSGYNNSKDMSILRFRESIARSILLGKDTEFLKPGPAPSIFAKSKRKLGDHKLMKKAKTEKDMRRRCVGCYNNFRQKAFSSKEECVNVRKVNTYCDSCDGEPAYCLECFNSVHFA